LDYLRPVSVRRPTRALRRNNEQRIAWYFAEIPKVTADFGV
jgi:hypothetical protein